jgi:LysR family cyn operon transcriptional activator
MPLSAARALRLTRTQRGELARIAAHPGTPQAIALRCRVVLGAAEGIANNELARRLSTSLPTVLLWRRRFEERGLPGIVQDNPRPGRPRCILPHKEAAIVEVIRGGKPKDATHGSVPGIVGHQSIKSATGLETAGNQLPVSVGLCTSSSTRNIELRHIRYFLRAAELLHFTRAAESLYISQPTLSIHIQQLEEEFDAPLFDRSRQLRLTETGEVLLGHARNVIRELELAREEIADFQGLLRGTLRIGSAQLFSKKLVPVVLADYNKAYPNIGLTVQFGSSSEIEQNILARIIDIGLALLPPESHEIEYETLISDEMVVVVSHKHPLAQKSELSKAELSGLALVIQNIGNSTRRLIDVYFAKENISPKIMLQINDTPALFAMVESGRAGAIVSRRLAASTSLRLISLPGRRIVRTAGILKLRNVRLSAAATEFVKLAKAHFSDSAFA